MKIYFQSLVDADCLCDVGIDDGSTQRQDRQPSASKAVNAQTALTARCASIAPHTLAVFNTYKVRVIRPLNTKIKATSDGVSRESAVLNIGIACVEIRQYKVRILNADFVRHMDSPLLYLKVSKALPYYRWRSSLADGTIGTLARNDGARGCRITGRKFYYNSSGYYNGGVSRGVLPIRQVVKPPTNEFWASELRFYRNSSGY
ncbi:MAG: hypothetical protein K0U39_08635 [Alphaproteobacteria bacterium]|nr:hypothetical protein [Alphaproteobacteria bacterium]